MLEPRKKILRLDELAIEDANVGAHNAYESLSLLNGFLSERLKVSHFAWFPIYRGSRGRNAWYEKHMQGWKIMDLKSDGWCNPFEDSVKSRVLKASQKQNCIGPLLKKIIETVGEARIVKSQERNVVDSKWTKEIYKMYDIGDCFSVCFPVTEYAESVIVLGRSEQLPKFSDEDGQLALSSTKIISRTHKWLLLERGLIPPASKPLSPREKQILNLLFSSLDENQIADKLQLAKGTVHNYITDIYRNFKVQRRHHLTNLWLT